jgi:CTP:molybdopterin cytidylyltransferase MocA/Na+/melibiose symporter-like transporter
LLAQGVSRGNFAALLIASYFSIGLMNQVGTLRGYLFEEILKVPAGEQGRLAMRLDFASEIPGLFLAMLIGAASDRAGRRTIYALGFLFMGCAYFLFPFAGLGMGLYGLVILAALGSTCISAMLAAVIAEYPAERARGKLVGICFFLNGVGVATLVVSMSRLPSAYKSAGADAIAAGQYTYWTAAALCVIPLLAVWFGLARQRPSQQSLSADLEPELTVWQSLMIGVRSARDPRIRLAYFSAMVTRASLSVVSGFFFLWMTRAGADQGMDAAAAYKAGAPYFFAIQAVATLWAICVIRFIDRFDRTLALAIGAGLACASYTAIGLIENPFQPVMFAAAVFMGIGEMSGILASQSLMGQVAPERGRGGVIGVFTFCGSLGIIIAAVIGGYLFDMWRYNAPYFVMGVASGLLALLALYTYRTTRNAPWTAMSEIADGGNELHVVVLAAGASSRFGSPKQLVRVNGRPLLHAAVSRAVEVGGHAVTVVLGANANVLSPLLKHTPASVTINRDWAEGMASSIRAGLHATPGTADAVLICLADQAAVSAEDLRRLVASWRRNTDSIVAALYSGDVGAPAIFPRWCFRELLEIRGDRGARTLMQRHLDRLVRVPMPSAAVDIDTPEDLLNLESAGTSALSENEKSS